MTGAVGFASADGGLAVGEKHSFSVIIEGVSSVLANCGRLATNSVGGVIVCASKLGTICVLAPCAVDAVEVEVSALRICDNPVVSKEVVEEMMNYGESSDAMLHAAGNLAHS